MSIIHQKITIQALIRGILENGFSFRMDRVPNEPEMMQFCVDKRNAFGEQFHISKEDSYLMEHRRNAPEEVLMYYDVMEQKIIGCTFSFYQLFKKIKEDCKDRVYTPDKGEFSEVTDENLDKAMSLREAIEARHADQQLVVQDG